MAAERSHPGADTSTGTGNDRHPGRSADGTTVPVLIVGAGPTGLALAAQLHAFGIATRVVEQRLHPQPSRAFVVQPRTLEVLTPTGIADRLVAGGDASARARLRARTSRGERQATVSLARPGTTDTAYPYLLTIPQATVEHQLTAHLAERGLRIDTGVRLRSLALEPDGVRCRLVHHRRAPVDTAPARAATGNRGQEQVEQVEEVVARWVVGCDGADSTVRRRAGIPFPTTAYRPQLLLADVDLDGDIEGGVIQGLIDPGGVVFAFPFPGNGEVRLLTVVRPDHQHLDDETVIADLVRRLFAGAGANAEAGAVALERVRWSERVELRRGQANRYRRGRILLAGDAAHVHSPAAAQGMNTGLHDAVNLGWKLALVASGHAPVELLDTYERERWPVARWTRRLTDAAFLLEAGDRAPVRWLRRTVAPWLLPLIGGRRLPGPLFRLMGGLWTRYGSGPVAEEGRPRLRRGAQAGGRLPDGEVLADGRTTRLHLLLRPPGFHLLLCGDGSGTEGTEGDLTSLRSPDPVPLSIHRLSATPSLGVLWDPDGLLLRRLGIGRSGVILVRPDGYIGYRDGGASVAGVRRHLDRLTPPETSRRRH